MPNDPTDTDLLNFLIDENCDLTQHEGNWKGRYLVTTPSSKEFPLGGSFFADDGREAIKRAMNALEAKAA
jgi:hypothetical protein